MKILAITDKRYAFATRAVVRGFGGRVITCPPDDANTITPADLQGYDAIYIDLHGTPGAAYLWSGKAQDEPALSLKAVKGAVLDGVLVFATTCHLPETPFSRAFTDAGAIVVAGSGANYGGRFILSGAQILARLLFVRMARGESVDGALISAKRALRRRRATDKRARDDALEFTMLKRGNDGENKEIPA